MPLTDAERKAVSRAKLAGAAAQKYPGLPVGDPDYFTEFQFAVRKAYAEALWASHAARGENDLRPAPKANKPEKKPFRP